MTIYAQISQENISYYKTDSSVVKYDKFTKLTSEIYRAKEDEKVIDFSVNWKQGIIVLVNKQDYPLIFRIGNKRGINDTLYYKFNSDGEGYNSVSNIDISPTGDYMVMNMTYWESHGVNLYDFNKGVILKYLGNKIYIKHFIKWLPFNSILFIQTNGSDIDGADDMKIYNYNIENNLYKTWSVSNALYEGIFEGYDYTLLIYRSFSKKGSSINQLNLNPGDLMEIKSKIDNKKLNFNFENHAYELDVNNELDKSFILKLRNISDSSIVFQNEYELSYSQFDTLVFKSVTFDEDSSIIVKYIASKYINKRARSNYGYVLFYVNIDGELFKKEFDNIIEYRVGFTTQKYESIFEKGKYITKKYINNKYVKTTEKKSIIPEIPKQILTK